MKLVVLVCLFGAAVAYPRQDLFWDGKYGECPDVVVGNLMCVELDSCKSDLECPGTQKCCESTCDKGNVCLHPVEPPGIEKPGQCPISSEQPEDLCTETAVTCTTDVECTSVQKCCDTKCGDKRCLIPTDAEEIIRQKWKSFLSRKKESCRLRETYPPPPMFFQTLYNKTDAIKMCTSTSLEWKKCQRMASELTYTLQPKRDWGCALATSKEHCMYWLSQGYVDIMTTRDEDIYLAKTKYKLKPVAYEVPYTQTDPTTTISPLVKVWQNVTLVIAPIGTSANTWAELSGTTSCHAHANSTSAFKSPVCSLIEKDVIPRKGDFVESASEFFDEMCVPDILNKTYNKNETYPANLVSRCPDVTQQRKYEGVEGSLRCLDDTKAQVTFVDQKVIQNMIDTETELTTQGQTIVTRQVDNYKLICQDRSYPLTDWQVKACHVSVTPYPTIYMTPKKDDVWKTAFQQVLKEAVQSFTSKKNTEDFRIFESSPYTSPETGLPGKDVIFYDESKNFTMVTDEDTYAQDFMDTIKTCNELQPKPRAKFCVTTTDQYTKCMEMKKYFDLSDKVKDVAWGCMNASTELECMKSVLNGSADLMTTDAMATFIAGHDFKLQPIISQYLRKESGEQTYDWKTYTYTVGLMKKSFVTNRYGNDAKYINLTQLNTCHAGVNKISSFHHPIGWLLANGTIPRIGSVFESVSRFFANSCLPGVHPDVFRWDSDLVLGHEVNWGVPGLYFFNFTQPEWFIWNSPHTWSYYNWNKKTPRFFRYFFRGENDKGKLGLGLSRKDAPTNMDAEVLSVILDQLPSAPETKDYLRLDKSKWSTGTTRDGTTLTDRVSDIIENKESPDIDPTISRMWSQLLQMRFDAIEQVDEALSYFHDVPKMMNAQKEENTWLNHPAVKSFLQIYTPQLLDYFSELFDNSELREREFSRYANPLWLSPTFDDFLQVTKTHQTKLCHRCIGYEAEKCTLDDEPYSDYRGSLNCLKDNSGDIVFLESHKLDNLVDSISELDYNNLVLVCPTGEVVDYVKGDVDVVKRCNFGRVPQPAIVTSFNKSGSYRWNITKALLYAQDIYSHHHQNTHSYKMFGLNSVFHSEAIKLYPINLVNQTYQPWLGPMFLRSMEALVKPSSFDWWKEKSQSCWGETYSNVLTQRNDTCNAIVKDITCAGTPPKKLVNLANGEMRMIKMCSRPTRYTRQMANFKCDNGNSYMKKVMVPTACECVPCEEMAVSASWNKDYFWTRDERKYMTATTDQELTYLLWGNEDYWADNTLNTNFGLEEEFERLQNPTTTSGSNTTPKEVPQCEAPWMGTAWQPEWFPRDNKPMCRVPGLSTQDVIQKMIDRWDN